MACVVFLPLTCLADIAAAQDDTRAALERCAAIGAATHRLVCYDRLADRATPLPDAAMKPEGTPAAGALPVWPLAPDGALPSDRPPTGGTGLLSQYWELEASDKRGIFNFLGYRPNYVLPIHVTTRINRAPQSPTQSAVAQPAYRVEEAKFQLSLRTKLVQGLLLPGADLWATFTQQVMWQIYNGTDSKPFRNSDYEPEFLYVLPTAPSLRQLPFGWQWRYTQLGLAHQSNGQSDPLSRSWNRVYLGAGFERAPWVLRARINKRISEPLESDNNPDLTAFRGRGEFQLGWASGLHTANLQYRSTLRDVKYGSLQFEWTYPVFDDHPNGLRWFVQVFSGYGETLTDYNFRQNSIGAGLTFLNF